MSATVDMKEPSSSWYLDEGVNTHPQEDEVNTTSFPDVIGERMRFIDTEGEEIGAYTVDLLYDKVQFGDEVPKSLLSLSPVEEGLVIAAVRSEESKRRAFNAAHLQVVIGGWTDAEVVNRIGVHPSLVPFMRRTSHGWYVDAVYRLANYLGVDFLTVLGYEADATAN